MLPGKAVHHDLAPMKQVLADVVNRLADVVGAPLVDADPVAEGSNGQMHPLDAVLAAVTTTQEPSPWLNERESHAVDVLWLESSRFSHFGLAHGLPSFLCSFFAAGSSTKAGASSDIRRPLF